MTLLTGAGALACIAASGAVDTGPPQPLERHQSMLLNQGEACHSSLRGDVQAGALCSSFCTEESRKMHCKRCQCRACQFCGLVLPVGSSIFGGTSSASSDDTHKHGHQHSSHSSGSQFDYFCRTATCSPWCSSKSKLADCSECKCKACDFCASFKCPTPSCEDWCDVGYAKTHCPRCKCAGCSFCSRGVSTPSEKKRSRKPSPSGRTSLLLSALSPPPPAAINEAVDEEPSYVPASPPPLLVSPSLAALSPPPLLGVSQPPPPVVSPPPPPVETPPPPPKPPSPSSPPACRSSLEEDMQVEACTPIFCRRRTREDDCLYCKCRACAFCTSIKLALPPPPPPSPPPAPSPSPPSPPSPPPHIACHTQLEDDVEFEACTPLFCRKRTREDDCLYCKCRACDFCVGLPAAATAPVGGRSTPGSLVTPTPKADSGRNATGPGMAVVATATDTTSTQQAPLTKSVSPAINETIVLANSSVAVGAQAGETEWPLISRQGGASGGSGSGLRQRVEAIRRVIGVDQDLPLAAAVHNASAILGLSMTAPLLVQVNAIARDIVEEQLEQKAERLRLGLSLPPELSVLATVRSAQDALGLATVGGFSEQLRDLLEHLEQLTARVERIRAELSVDKALPIKEIIAKAFKELGTRPTGGGLIREAERLVKLLGLPA